jgi:flagellar protein FliS
MAPKQAYQAYSLATQTAPKTRQVVMLYDGVIRFIKQAQFAISEKRIEDRFNLLLKASKIITGLQTSLDFDTGGEVTQMAHTLHRFYTGMNVRILSVNFCRDPIEGKNQCETLIDELQQMRAVWDNIDRNIVHNSGANPVHAGIVPAVDPAGTNSENGSITFSA